MSSGQHFFAFTSLFLAAFIAVIDLGPSIVNDDLTEVSIWTHQTRP